MAENENHKGGLGSEDLKNLEEAPGSFYKPGQSQESGGFGEWAKKRRKKIIIAAVAAIASVVAAIIIFISLLPFKLLHIVNNIQDRFYSSANNAVQKEVDTLFSDYLRRHVIPGVQKCRGSTISINCRPGEITSTGLVSNLYKGWRDARFERLLAQNYGIEVLYDSSANGYKVKLKMPGMNDGGISLEKFEKDPNLTLTKFIADNPELTRYGKRSQVAEHLKAVLNLSLEGQSSWKKTMVRFKAARLFENKYGVKLCMVACKYTGNKLVNNWRDWKDEKKRTAKIILSQRVLLPRQQMMGIAMLCLLKPECDPLSLSKSDPQVTKDGCQSNCTDNGEPKSATEREMEDRIASLAAGYGLTFTADGLKNAVELTDSIRKNGFSATSASYVYTQVKDYMTGEGGNVADRAEQLKKYFLGLGYAITASYLIEAINKMPEKIEKLNYDINTANMAQTWAMYRTYVDECNKEGACDATMFGSFVNSLQSGDQDPGSNEKQLGGTAGAEASPLYQNVVNDNPNNQRNGFASLFGIALAAAPNCSDRGGSDKYVFDRTGNPDNYYDPFVAKLNNQGGTIVTTNQDGSYRVSFSSNQTKTYSAPSDYCDPGDGRVAGPGYKCNDGKPPAGGKLGCPEYNLHQLTFISKGIQALQGDPIWQSISFGAGIINRVVNGVLQVAIKAIKACGSNVCFFVEPAIKAVGDGLQILAEATKVSELIQGLLGKFQDLAFPPSPFSQRMSGARTVDLMIGGADVTGNEFAHRGIGGKKLSPQEVKANLAEQYQQQWLAYSGQSFFARMFDTQSKYSPVTRLALVMPTNWSGLSAKLASVFRNPFSIFGSSFNTLAATGTGYAATPVVVSDPFDLAQYGYSINDSIFSQNPEDYWNNNCTDGSKTASWNTEAIVNATPENNYMPDNYDTNPCLLLQTSVGAAGALFTDKVLSPEDTVDTSAVGGEIDCSSGGFQPGDWSTVPDAYKAAVEAYAPPRTQSGGCGSYPNAHPSDPSKMFFGQCAYTDCKAVSCTGEDLGPRGGSQYPGRLCIGVKYRNPPNGGDTIIIPID